MMQRGATFHLTVLAAALALGLSGCRSGSPEVKVQHLPPTPKDVLDALLASSQVPLSVDSSCRDVGTEPTDKTIGRYLSGFLTELSNPEAKNAIETSIEAQGSVWIGRVMIRHALGEDVWRWGVQFSIRQKDGVVMPDSFRCLGAG